LGARADVLAKVIEKVRRDYPALSIAGARDGYWKAEEEEMLVEEIRRAEPDILFVAISSPRKERFLRGYQGKMEVPFAMGVGGTFDVAAGETKRAPKWMQRTGFEWFFRFVQEPRRMFRRYFVEDMYFFWLLGAEVWRSRIMRYRRERNR
jgi:N-acetylglucosaminyldiphosphoundecaprenol N-acetyl-beta-D-mannosaminyltransferase